ncbi:MAG TPA: cytochrome c-type biogenesis protein CcmH [Candidatus Methylomirabilis sp.]|nr:cytochrome c-type biogenesis protein CcmH [Candidatus Methylomirabilis sp.]
MRWPDPKYFTTNAGLGGSGPPRPALRRAVRQTALMVAWVVVSWLLAPAALALVVSDVAKEFVCNCGCNKMLTDCDMKCGEQLRGVIAGKIAEGWDKPRIMDLLVKNYGEKLLAAPTKSGFNLTAWVTPFAAILLGGVMISLAVGEWVARRRATQRVRLEAPRALVEGKYLDRVDEELKCFD